jgi:hypothetical protein
MGKYTDSAVATARIHLNQIEDTIHKVLENLQPNKKYLVQLLQAYVDTVVIAYPLISQKEINNLLQTKIDEIEQSLQIIQADLKF